MRVYVSSAALSEKLVLVYVDFEIVLATRSSIIDGIEFVYLSVRTHI